MAQGDSCHEQEGGHRPGKAWIAVAPAVLLFGLFLYEISGIWHPLVILGALGFFLWPERRTDWVRRLLYTALGLASVWLLWLLRRILAPLLIALSLAYVFKPVVEWLCGNAGRWRPLRLSRSFASLLVTVLLFGFAGFLGAEIGSLLINQSEELARLTTGAGEAVRRAIPPSWSDNEILYSIAEDMASTVEEFVAGIPRLSREIDSALAFAATGALGVLMTLIIFYYCVKDFNRLLSDFSHRILPARFRIFAESRAGRHSVTLRKFLGGYFITSSVVFVLTLALLLAFRIRLALVLALLAAVLNIVPVVGFWASTAVTLVVALSTGVALGPVLLLGLGLALINVFEGNMLQPRILSPRVGLHPVAVIVSMGVFGKLLGIPGILLGVPLAAIATREWEDFKDRWERDEKPHEDGPTGGDS